MIQEGQQHLTLPRSRPHSYASHQRARIAYEFKQGYTIHALTGTQATEGGHEGASEVPIPSLLPHSFVKGSM